MFGQMCSLSQNNFWSIMQEVYLYLNTFSSLYVPYFPIKMAEKNKKCIEGDSSKAIRK